MVRRNITVTGRNCWRRVEADRVAFLIDGAAYFGAVADAMARAERSILILAWDIDSRMRLHPERDGGASPGRTGLRDELGEFLNELVARRPRLEAHVLDWDYAMIYALEREALPVVKLGWRTHPRLHFHLDGEHPLGGSHHQKIVVVDDRIAFVGGLDLCSHRWDTPEHRAADSHRVDPSGKPYAPFHDVQIAVSGRAARDARAHDPARAHRLRSPAGARFRRLHGRRSEATNRSSVAKLTKRRAGAPPPCGLDTERRTVMSGQALVATKPHPAVARRTLDVCRRADGGGG
jgi:phosphatidylserine/phosphatidylglycerophosphate/cardiolipin synthase-like enzyme